MAETKVKAPARSGGVKEEQPQIQRERKYIFRTLAQTNHKTLPFINLVMDVTPDGKARPRWARFIEGIDTYWKDEQDARKIDNRWAEENSWRPVFSGGFLTLTSPVDDLKIEYLMKLDGYDQNKNRMGTKPPVFTLENRPDKASQELEFARLQKKASDAAWEAIEQGQDFSAHARYLGISLIDGYGNLKEPDVLQSDYVKVAMTRPDVFLKSLNSPVVKIRDMVSRGIAAGIIDLNHMRGQAHWGDSKTYITMIDLSQPEESLSDFAQSEDGDDFLQILKQKLSK